MGILICEAISCKMAKTCAYSFWFCCTAALCISICGASVSSALDPLVQHRKGHRKTTDGRLCAAAFVHNDVTHTNCASTTAPDGTVGTEWCYVEQQAVVGGAPMWDFCSPRVDYAELRRAVGYMFEEKAYELADATDVLLDLGKETTNMIERVDAA